MRWLDTARERTQKARVQQHPGEGRGKITQLVYHMQRRVSSD